MLSKRIWLHFWHSKLIQELTITASLFTMIRTHHSVSKLLLILGYALMCISSTPVFPNTCTSFDTCGVGFCWAFMSVNDNILIYPYQIYTMDSIHRRYILQATWTMCTILGCEELQRYVFHLFYYSQMLSLYDACHIELFSKIESENAFLQAEDWIWVYEAFPGSCWGICVSIWKCIVSYPMSKHFQRTSTNGKTIQRKELNYSY